MGVMPVFLSVVLSTVFVVYKTNKNLPFDRCIVSIDIKIHRSKTVSNARSTIISRSIDSIDSACEDFGITLYLR